MTDKHLLWWIFKELEENHPETLRDLLADISGDKNNTWVGEALRERYDAYRKEQK